MRGAPTALHAIVLRATRYGDADLIIDLLTEEEGRRSAVARGARRSQKRYGGALQLGTRLSVVLRPGRGTLPSLQVEAVRQPVRAVLDDLDAIAHLSYVIELARLTTNEGLADAGTFKLVVAYFETLEGAPPSLEALTAWELTLLAHQGHRLGLDRCVLTGRVPDAISLGAGGAIWCGAARGHRYTRVPPRALETMARLARGDHGACFEPGDAAAVRGALEMVWRGIGCPPLRTAAYLLPMVAPDGFNGG